MEESFKQAQIVRFIKDKLVYYSSDFMNWGNFVGFEESEINGESMRGKNKKGRMITIDDTEIRLPMNYF